MVVIASSWIDLGVVYEVRNEFLDEKESLNNVVSRLEGAVVVIEASSLLSRSQRGVGLADSQVSVRVRIRTISVSPRLPGQCLFCF